MNYVEFSARYNADVNYEIPEVTKTDIRAIPDGNFDTLYSSSHAWSKIFGSLLLNHLMGTEDKANPGLGQVIESYQKWDASVFSSILSTAHNWTKEMSSDAHSEEYREATRLRQNASFHEINRNHLEQWFVLLNGGEPAAIRLAAQDSKFLLAVIGSHYAHQRDKEIQEHDAPNWFSKERFTDRSSLEGFLNEVDAGIVLNDLAARSDHEWLCLPAPYQFESEAFAQNGALSANADFIIVDPTKSRVVGVQIKSSVRASTVSEYDPERIVLIDGRMDLGNEASMRTERHSSDTRVVS